MLRYVIVAAFAVACLGPAHGADKEHRRHGAHEHGTAQLNLAWEGNSVTIELESPALNIVGFEHAPRTDAQKKTVQSALATLKNANDLFSFTPDARCTGQVTEVESELATAKAGTQKKGRDDDHSEFLAKYRFTCEKPDALKAVDVHLFKLFPKTGKLRVQTVSPKGQAATELRPGSSRLTLR